MSKNHKIVHLSAGGGTFIACGADMRAKRPLKKTHVKEDVTCRSCLNSVCM